jgi:uncharacterized protein (TIGR00251 family)
MKISVRVQPKAKQEKIEEVGPNELKVYFNVPPEQGKANAKLVEMLAEYYQVSKSDVYIVTGSRSQSKVVEIFNLE